MPKIFFISGLGADYRLFKNIRTAGFEIVYVHWIEPENNDTLATYARKLIDAYCIEHGSIVIGVSLGGMLTVEIAKQASLSRAILISSIKTSNEAPWYFSFFRKFPVYKIIPGGLLTSMGMFIKPVFGHMSKEDGLMFKSMLENSSPAFIKWAMQAVLNWESKTVPLNVYHIIGNKDMVFNYKKIKGATIIDGGTHIMVFDKAEQINKLLGEVVSGR
jgi:pimeloyl-ACP methyl ester carboxylesterase